VDVDYLIYNYDGPDHQIRPNPPGIQGT